MRVFLSPQKCYQHTSWVFWNPSRCHFPRENASLFSWRGSEYEVLRDWRISGRLTINRYETWLSAFSVGYGFNVWWQINGAWWPLKVKTRIAVCSKSGRLGFQAIAAVLQGYLQRFPEDSRSSRLWSTDIKVCGPWCIAFCPEHIGINKIITVYI